MTNGYRIIQVSALGRRPVAMFSGKSSAEASAARLNMESTGERYEVEWYIGEPRRCTNLRRHYFPANDRTVITGLCANGQYGAFMDDDQRRGYGHSRYSAIADLVEVIAKTDLQEMLSEERANV